MAKLLLVEDDKELSEKISEWLDLEKFTVEVAHTGSEAMDRLAVFSYDLIILDWDLPELSGIEVLKQFRSLRGTTPVLMLTGKTEIESKEQGLDSGADDYLTKPFHLRELTARLRALLRRPKIFSGHKLSAGDVVLLTDSRTVTKEGQPVHLLPLEFALLELFMRHPGQVFTQEALLDRVWKDDSSATGTALRTYIKTLRKKLDTEGKPSLIRTIHGVGYKWAPEDLQP